MKNSNQLICAMGALLALQGCAHKTVERNLDEKLAGETRTWNRTALRTEAADKIANLPGLTTEQRSQLVVLRDSVGKQLDGILDQSLKLRAVLINDVLSQNYNADEVTLIRGRLRKLEDKRISVMFAAVDQANTILGRNAINNPKIRDEYWELMGIRAGREQ